MASFAGRVARMQDVVFRTLGEDARWSGVAGPVRVRFRTMDDLEGFGGGRIIVESTMIQVRRSEVETPRVGDTVTLDATGVIYRVTADPTLDRKGRWTCVVAEA